MDRDIEIYDAEEFHIKHNDIHKIVWKMLNGIPGEWEFSQYCISIYEGHIGIPGITHHMIVFNDLNDEDRCFSMEWDNADIPIEKAHIEVATD